MAIRDIITRGYGNGTFSPGVNKLPTRGYSIGAAIVITGLFPGDTTFSRQGPGDTSGFSRQGPGNVSISKKQS